MEANEFWITLEHLHNYQINQFGHFKVPDDFRGLDGKIAWNHGRTYKSNKLTIHKIDYSISKLVFDHFFKSNRFTLNELLSLYGFEIKERLKYVEGYEYKYVISESGRFFSLYGKFGFVHEPKGSICSGGYIIHSLRDGTKKEDLRLHRILANNFLDGKFENAHVNHKDGNKLNNSLENLEWCTNVENINHARETGLCDLNGEKSHFAKLDSNTVLKIKELSETEPSNTKIANIFNISKGTVNRIRHNKTWKHLLTA